MTDEPTMLDLVGLWECGECGQITDVSHFYEDRMTGQMGHEADAERRQEKADRCGWSFDYEDGYGVQRCKFHHEHVQWPANQMHRVHAYGCGPFSSSTFRSRPPYDPATANGANA